MFMVFTAERERRNSILNLFRRWDGCVELELITSVKIETCFEYGWVEVWQIEFGECSPRLETLIRRALDAWKAYEEPLMLEVLDTDCPELQTMLMTPDPERPSLTWAIRRYKLYHSGRWEDFWDALGACLVVPDDFLQFLKAKGVVSQCQMDSGYARVVCVNLGNPKYATPDFPTEVHCVVQVGRIVIDWTARQYPDMYHHKGYDPIPVPLVWVNRTAEDQAFGPRKAP